MICVSESQLIHKYGNLIFKSSCIIKTTRGWVGIGLHFGVGGSGSVPVIGEIFFHPKTDVKPGSPSSLASPRHDREGALFPSSPRPNSTPRMGRGLSQSCYLLDTNFEHKAMCTNSYTGRVQKRILRRWLQFLPAVTLDDLIFLHNCVGFLHIFCRNICTHRSV